MGGIIMLEKTKKFVKEHKYQLIAGASIAATGVVSILLLKEKVNHKALLESLNNQTEMNDILKDFIIMKKGKAFPVRSHSDNNKKVKY